MYLKKFPCMCLGEGIDKSIENFDTFRANFQIFGKSPPQLSKWLQLLYNYYYKFYIRNYFYLT